MTETAQDLRSALEKIAALRSPNNGDYISIAQRPLATPARTVEPAATCNAGLQVGAGVKDGLTSDDRALRQAADTLLKTCALLSFTRKTAATRALPEHMAALRKALTAATNAALSTQAAYPTGAGEGLPADVIALVVAGRKAWEFLQEHQPHDGVTAALDKALERFASRVCYDDEGGDLPDAHADPCTCGATLQHKGVGQ